MTMASRDEIAEVLSFYDKVGDGKVEIEQIGTCLRTLGIAPFEYELAKAIKPFEKGTRVSVEEILPVYNELRKKSKQMSTDEMVSLLTNFDGQGHGTIHIMDLRYILINGAEKLSEKEADSLLVGEADKDGRVNIGEFTRKILG
uniref:EF-hand domain-containing protein n=1 Tax=Panagrellus redivivus TaxID=6233 RepID=A0A7E4UWD8_PANRE